MLGHRFLRALQHCTALHCSTGGYCARSAGSTSATNTHNITTSTSSTSSTKPVITSAGHVENEGLAHQEMDLRWDYASGQFSWSQDNGLERAARTVLRRAGSTPHQVVAVWMRGDEQEENISYCELQQMVEHVQGRIEQVSVSGGLVVLLPVSPLVLAVLLACAATNTAHSLVLAGFSPSALSQVLAGFGPATVVTSDYWPQLLKTVGSLSPHPPTLLIGHTCGMAEAKPVIQTKKDLGNSDRAEDEEPLFALYCSGETGVIAGLGQEAGYYQVTSSLGLSGSQRRLDSSRTEDLADPAIKEERFKAEKRQNSFRLDYIQDMLQAQPRHSD